MKSKVNEWLTPENLIRLEGWAKDGLTKEQIAHNIGISKVTLWEWEKKQPNILNAIKRGKEVADREVENALYKSALGYDVIEETKERRLNKTTKEYELVVTKRTVRHIPPSNVAQIFWLKNRKPDTWKDKQEVTDTKALDKLDGILEILKDEADREAE